MIENVTFAQRSRLAPPVQSSSPISLTDAFIHTHRYRTVENIAIPVAWEFDARDLLDILLPSQSTGREVADGIRFYASVNPTDEGHWLKLVAIGIKVDEADSSVKNDMHTGITQLYDFSRICPVVCDKSSSPLRDPDFYARVCS